MRIRELSKEDRPRERFAESANQVSLVDLVAILLRTGREGHSVLEISAEVVQMLESLNGFEDLHWRDLTAIKGIGRDKAITLCAAIELGRRLSQSSFSRERPLFNSPDKVSDYFMEMLRHESQEHFYVAFVNVKNRMLGKKEIGVGNLNAAPVDVREIMKWAVRFNAFGMILIHNHPSGDPNPSEEDIQLTKVIRNAAQIFGIRVLDHVIIGDQRYVSFMERGYL